MFPLIFNDVLDLKLYQAVDDELRNGWSLSVCTAVEEKNANKHWGKENKYDLIFLKAATCVKYKIKKFIKHDIKLCKILINGQTRGQESFFHVDFPEDYFLTFVLFASPLWDTNWGGEFVCFDSVNKEYKHVAYTPNRGVLIPSNWSHVGHAPNLNTHEIRSSIAFSFIDTQYQEEAICNYSTLPQLFKSFGRWLLYYL